MTPNTDYVSRNKLRTLPVELDDDELLQIARAKARRELRIGKLQEDLAAEVRRRKAEIETEAKAVAVASEELDTGKQLREVKTDEMWISGQVHAIRLDTGEVFERRAPTASEQQRRIPGSDASAPLLNRARAAQADLPTSPAAKPAEVAKPESAKPDAKQVAKTEEPKTDAKPNTPPKAGAAKPKATEGSRVAHLPRKSGKGR